MPRRGACYRASARGSGRCAALTTLRAGTILPTLVRPACQATVPAISSVNVRQGGERMLLIPAVLVPAVLKTWHALMPRARVRWWAARRIWVRLCFQAIRGVTRCVRAWTSAGLRRDTRPMHAAISRCLWGRAASSCRWGRRRCPCLGLVPTVLRGGLACGTRTARPRPSLASWNFPWAIWRPCQRRGITWGRWAAFAPRATASVGLPILLMIMLASAHPSTAMALVPSVVAASQ